MSSVKLDRPEISLSPLPCLTLFKTYFQIVVQCSFFWRGHGLSPSSPIIMESQWDLLIVDMKIDALRCFQTKDIWSMNHSLWLFKDLKNWMFSGLLKRRYFSKVSCIKESVKRVEPRSNSRENRPWVTTEGGKWWEVICANWPQGRKMGTWDFLRNVTAIYLMINDR